MSTAKSNKLFKTSNLLIFTLIVGLVAGAYGYNVFITPRVDSLNEELTQKTSQVASLQSQLDELQVNYTEALGGLVQVTQQYNDLMDNSVTRSEYEDLEEDYESLLGSFQDQEEELALLQATNQDLTVTNTELSTEYQKLLLKYNELRMLPWTAFIVGNLRVNLTVTTNNYPSNVPVTGTINIHYLDGRPYNGRFQLLVWSDYYRSGKSSTVMTVSGSKEYTIESPFMFGPGNYFLLVSSIKDSLGNEIVSYNDLLMYRVSLQMG
ncbi:hypothetical protein E2P71_04605 [Candidatus Bathyarchaeota archaeon]|nr:hypothetical protein E2P71_04605 [Candidatus Bathyarchaeota archaeon]